MPPHPASSQDASGSQPSYTRDAIDHAESDSDYDDMPALVPPTKSPPHPASSQDASGFQPSYTRDAIDHAESDSDSDTDDDMPDLVPVTEEDRRKDAEEVRRRFTEECLRMIEEAGMYIVRHTEDTPNGIVVHYFATKRARGSTLRVEERSSL